MTDEFVQFAQKALIIKNDKLLMIKKSNLDKNSPNKWEVPGGRKQVGESLDEHIIREVKEEVNLDIKPNNIFTMWDVSVNIKNKPTTIVAVSRFCDVINEDICITEDVIDNYKWININEDLLKYDIMQGLRPTIEKLVAIYKKN